MQVKKGSQTSWCLPQRSCCRSCWRWSPPAEPWGTPGVQNASGAGRSSDWHLLIDSKQECDSENWDADGITTFHRGQKSDYGDTINSPAFLRSMLPSTMCCTKRWTKMYLNTSNGQNEMVLGYTTTNPWKDLHTAILGLMENHATKWNLLTVHKECEIWTGSRLLPER